MDLQEKKQFLSQYIEVDRHIRAITMEYNRIMTLATNVSRTMSETPEIHTNSVESKVEKCAIKLAELSSEISKQTGELIEKRTRIENAIDGLPYERYREILRYKYLAGMRNSEIAADIGKSERWVARLIRKSIDKLDL